MTKHGQLDQEGLAWFLLSLLGEDMAKFVYDVVEKRDRTAGHRARSILNQRPLAR